MEVLLKLLYRHLITDGIIMNAGKMVDASFVELLIQRNSRDDNEKIKEGEVPEDWEENKLSARKSDQTQTFGRLPYSHGSTLADNRCRD